MSTQRMRQAVIVIHGMGEQRPMGTLRTFVKSILPEQPGKVKFFSKPDRMSESFELRKLMAPTTSKRPLTDFYEYYWAYHMQGTKFSHIWNWLKSLLFRKPKNIPKRLKFLYWLTWLLIALIALVGTGLLTVPQGLLPDFVSKNTVFWGWIGSAALLPAIHLIVLYYVGDAARYLSPTPGNIAVRHKIRNDGVKLLEHLHAAGKHNRIIVVGHSLGSVIAYDILKYYWYRVNTAHGKPKKINQDALKKVEKSGPKLDIGTTPDTLDAFREQQTNLWKEQRKVIGIDWKVTDLITLGSPLTHGEMLLADSRDEFNQRRFERELPSCPPQVSDDKGGYSYKSAPYSAGNKKRTVRLLHHAALFACTRWTNLYFPGDIVGGPLSPVLGYGIEDVEIKGSGIEKTWVRSPFSHTRYWYRDDKITPQSVGSSLNALVRALDLERRDLLR